MLTVRKRRRRLRLVFQLPTLLFESSRILTHEYPAAGISRKYRSSSKRPNRKQVKTLVSLQSKMPSSIPDIPHTR